MTTIPALAVVTAAFAARSVLSLAGHVTSQVVPSAPAALTLVLLLSAIACMVTMARAAHMAASLISQFLQVAARMASALFTLAIFVVLIIALLVQLR